MNHVFIFLISTKYILNLQNEYVKINFLGVELENLLYEFCRYYSANEHIYVKVKSRNPWIYEFPSEFTNPGEIDECMSKSSRSLKTSMESANYIQVVYFTVRPPWNKRISNFRLMHWIYFQGIGIKNIFRSFRKRRQCNWKFIVLQNFMNSHNYLWKQGVFFDDSHEETGHGGHDKMLLYFKNKFICFHVMFVLLMLLYIFQLRYGTQKWISIILVIQFWPSISA